MMAPGAGRMPLTPGSLVALATPMKADGSLDIPALRSVLQWHKVGGIPTQACGNARCWKAKPDHPTPSPHHGRPRARTAW